MSSTNLWAPNNPSCVWTWILLRDLGQHEALFKDAKEILMSSLRFWNSAASNEINILKAKELAAKLNNLIVDGGVATFELGCNSVSAILSLAEILGNGQMKISDLASVVDNAYHFRGEI